MTRSSGGWMMVAAFAACGFQASRAQDAGFEPFAPKLLPPGKGGTIEEKKPGLTTPGGQTDAVLVDAIRGIVLVNSTDRLREKSSRTGVQTPGFAPPAEATLEKALETHLDSPLSFQKLQVLCRVIVDHYRTQGFPIVDAIVPEGQDISNGIVQILVVEGKVGEVQIEGAEYFSPELLRSQLRVKQGDAIARDPLMADLDWINSNPFRRADVVFEPGDTFGSTNLILRTEDRLPWRFYTGIENTGVESTGENRIFTGFNHGNAFGLDHQWSAQFTSDSEFDRLNAWSSAYLIPLPSRHWLSIYGSYVESAPDNPQPFDEDGTNWELGASYRIPVFCNENLRHEWNFGYEFKRIDNNLQFGGTRVYANAVDVSQFLVGYEGAFTRSGSRSSWGGTLHMSPGGLGSHSNDEDYELANPGADATYAYLSGRFSHQQKLPWNLTWQLGVESQIATGNLIGSEQTGLGGFRSVRGYREYELTGDDALIVRNELRGPAFPVIARMNGKIQDELQPLVFVDWGTIWKDQPAATEDQRATLASAGMGVRYSFNPWVSAYLDWGVQLRDSGQDDPHASGFHFGITGSF